MKLSVPVYRLKREARRLARESGIALHEALDRIAQAEGFPRWSLLAATHASAPPAEELHARLAPGDLLLLGARPGQGKTLFGLELAIAAMKAGGRAVFFTLEYTVPDVLERLRAIGADPARFEGQFDVDCSDAIDADHIIASLDAAPRGTLAVIDYLQLLDQRRYTPALSEQVDALKVFARRRGVTIVFISQIDRSYDPSAKPFPDAGDVRLPNPLDLRLFDKTCFLNAGAVRFGESRSARP